MTDILTTIPRVLMYSMCVFALALGPSMADDDDDDDNDGRGETHTVNCDEDKSIQRKVDRSRPGDTVKVKGSCTENVIIRVDNLTLVCVYGASISWASGTAIIVRANDVQISDCTITGTSGSGSGVLVDRSSSAVLTDNTISGFRSAVTITQASYGRLIGTAQAPDAPSQSFTDNRTGVGVTGSSHVDVVRNHISDNSRDGLFLSRNSSADIVGNDFTDNGNRGVSLFRSSAGEFSTDITFGGEANRISGNGDDGIGCFDNGAVRFGVAQVFTGGNTGDNFFSPATADGGCTVSGTP